MKLSSIRKPLQRILHPLDYPDRQSEKEAKLERRRLKHDKPLALPNFRINISQLSLCHVERQHKQCAFWRLPVELRLYIYELAIGNNVLHLFHFPKCIKHTRSGLDKFTVPTPEQPAFNMANWRGISSTGVPLLLTCHAIYREAVDVLYGSNVFSLNDLNVLVYWNDLPLIPQPRMATIRHLKITWLYYKEPAVYLGLKYAPYDVHTWERFWQIIAHEMPALTSLDVRIEYVGIWEEPKLEQPWIEAMMGVKGIRDVTLQVLESTGSWDAKRVSEVEVAVEKAWKA